MSFSASLTHGQRGWATCRVFAFGCGPGRSLFRRTRIEIRLAEKSELAQDRTKLQRGLPSGCTSTAA